MLKRLAVIAIVLLSPAMEASAQSRFEWRLFEPARPAAPPRERYAPPPGYPPAGVPPARQAAPRTYRAPPVTVAPPPERRAVRIPFFERLFGGAPAPEPPQARPLYPDAEPPARRQRAAPSRERDRDGPSIREARPNAGPPPPRRVAVEQTTFVAVLGDSLAEDLSQGLDEALSDRPEVGLVPKVKAGAGFLEPESGWEASAREILAREKPVKAAVVMMTPYDETEQERAAAAAQSPGSRAPWMDLYAAKVDEFMLIFREKNVPVVWVGLPPVKNERVMGDYAFLNDLVRQRVTALGGTFVDAWEGFVNAEAQFDTQGPGVEGRVTRLRGPDGVRFTKAGARKLAHYVEVELRRHLSPKGEDPAFSVAAVREQGPSAPGSSRIILLGAPPATPGAGLATEEPRPSVETSDRAMVRGEPVAPKPGRADDFSWQ